MTETKTLKKKFELENPQIEISEVENINLDAQIMAERIVDSLERFGTSKFKGIGNESISFSFLPGRTAAYKELLVPPALNG